MSLRLSTPPGRGVMARRQRLGGQMWTLGKKGHRDLPLGGCRDGPWLSGAAGPWPARAAAGGCGASGAPGPSCLGGQSRVWRRWRRVAQAELFPRVCSRALRPPGSRPPAPPAPLTRAPPAPRWASVLSPSFLPPCGHRGQSSATSPRSGQLGPPALPPRQWAPRPRADALCLGGREGLRSEGGQQGFLRTETPPGIFEKFQATPHRTTAPTRPSKSGEDPRGHAFHKARAGRFLTIT